MGKLELVELYELLQLNEVLLANERRLDRQVDLLVHRSVLKDCIIEALQARLVNNTIDSMNHNNITPIRKAS